MAEAKDYLVFPLDVPSSGEARRLVTALAGTVGMFKVGLELFIEAGPDIVRFIRSAGSARVFLDLKLHDIPATVARAVRRIADLGVSLATVHCGESSDMAAAAVAAAGGRVGILGVTVLTSVGPADLRTAGFPPELADDPGRLVRLRARLAKDAGCAGVVCSPLEAADVKTAFGPDFMAVTPGIRPAGQSVSGDDQQRVATPARAIAAGADLLVVGRPIRDAADPPAAAAAVVEEIASALADAGEIRAPGHPAGSEPA